jgi:acylphosphatase
MADHERLRASVQGRVQGVGFRYAVLSEAKSLGLTGYVENLADGSVHVEAEGPPELLDRLEDFLRAGPRPARVEQLASERLGASGEFDGFSWH